MSASSFESCPAIPFDRVSLLVRRVTHDVRNGLNALDLQVTLLSELIEDPETSAETMRLRDMIGNVTRMLGDLSAEFQDLSLTPIVCEAGLFLEDVKLRLDHEHADRMEAVRWEANVGDARIEIDLEAVLQALSEIFANAFAFGDAGTRIEFGAEATEAEVRFTIREEKSEEPEDLASWGREPLRNVQRGGLGLGLFRVRRIAEAHGGDLRHAYDSANARLITTLAIPVTAHG
jgi:signal transduction histidine kinase